MAENTTGPLRYSRHTLEIGGHTDAAALARRFASSGDLVAVNIVLDEAGTSAAFCEAHLAAAIARAPRTVVVDAIPTAAFADIVTRKLALTEQEALALRGQLRGEPLAGAASQITAVGHHLGQALLLLDGFLLQRPERRLQSAVAALAVGRQSLLDAAAVADNVRAMDALHYEIVPALRSVASVLG